MRSYVVLGAGFLIVFLPFMGFVLFGWPGTEDICLTEGGPAGCYCEYVTVNDVLTHKAGVRQPANTWSNLYSLITGFIVAFGISRDRKRNPSVSPAKNLIRSQSFIADLYVFAVLFLGLGSMWFHASITDWGGRLDGASMYVFVGYLVWYTVHRIFPSQWLFWLGYLLTIAVFTSMHNWAPSVLLIGILVGAYTILEIIVIATGKARFNGWGWALLWWLCGLISFIIAVIFWIGGQDGSYFCDSLTDQQSAFQVHALWHVFCGVMAVFLYYYWRREEV